MNSDTQVKINGSPSISYHAMVEKLVKVFPRYESLLVADNIEFNSMASKLEICHSAMGVHTEAGEVADILKAIAIYDKPFDNEMRAALVKELGDLRFWIQDIQNKFMISDHEIVQGNADKLAARYKKLTYTDKQAIDRADKCWFIAYTKEHFEASEFIEGPFEHQYEAIQAGIPYGTNCYIGQAEPK